MDTVEWAGVDRAASRQVSSRLVPQLTMKRWLPLDSSNDTERRHRSGVHQHDGAAGVDALVAGVGGVVDRRATGIVIGGEGGDLVGVGGAHAVEVREGAVGVAEEAQHRHHAVDGGHQGRRRRQAACRVGLAQRQQVGQELDDHGRIAADVAAVGQDLAAEFLLEPACRLADEAGLVVDRQGKGGDGDGGEELGIALGGVEEPRPQAAHLAHQRTQEAAVEAAIGRFQNERRLGDPGQHALGDDLAGKGHGRRPRLAADPVGHQRPGVLAGEGVVGGAQMAQPAEAVQIVLPGRRRRRHVEGRAAAGIDDLAGEGEDAGVDVGGDGGVGGADVLRGDDQPFRLGARPAPAGKRPAFDRGNETTRGHLGRECHEAGGADNEPPRHLRPSPAP